MTMRLPDKPGQYRIRKKGADWVLSGLTPSGRRVKVAFDTEIQAKDAVPTLFSARTPTAYAAAPSSEPSKPTEDDWGIPFVPFVHADTVASVADAMGIPPALPATTPLPPGPPLPQDLPDPALEKKARENRERAKSLCEFFGVGWAMGDVWIATKMTESLGKEAVKPSTKQVNRLADSAQTAFESIFGDREIGPWTMLLLLTLAMPMSMILQSPKADPKKLEEKAAREGSHLSAV